MSYIVKESEEQLKAKGLEQLKSDAELQSWIKINRYFQGAGNGPEAKIAVVVIGNIIKERAIKNTTRLLDMQSEKMNNRLEGNKQFALTA